MKRQYKGTVPSLVLHLPAFSHAHCTYVCSSHFYAEAFPFLQSDNVQIHHVNIILKFNFKEILWRIKYRKIVNWYIQIFVIHIYMTIKENSQIAIRTLNEQYLRCIRWWEYINVNIYMNTKITKLNSQSFSPAKCFIILLWSSSSTGPRSFTYNPTQHHTAHDVSVLCYLVTHSFIPSFIPSFIQSVSHSVSQ